SEIEGMRQSVAAKEAELRGERERVERDSAALQETLGAKAKEMSVRERALSARAGSEHARCAARTDGPSVRGRSDGEAPRMGIPPDEPEVSGGTIQRDVRISNGRALEEIGRTRGPRAQPTGGARPAGAPAIQARGGSQGPIGQVRRSGGGVAAI